MIFLPFLFYSIEQFGSNGEKAHESEQIRSTLLDQFGFRKLKICKNRVLWPKAHESELTTQLRDKESIENLVYIVVFRLIFQLIQIAGELPAPGILMAAGLPTSGKS